MTSAVHLLPFVRVDVRFRADVLYSQLWTSGALLNEMDVPFMLHAAPSLIDLPPKTGGKTN
jgi:hypothetical protein